MMNSIDANIQIHGIRDPTKWRAISGLSGHIAMYSNIEMDICDQSPTYGYIY